MLFVIVAAIWLGASAKQAKCADDFDAASTLALYRPEIFTAVDSSVLIHDLSMLTILDGRYLPVSSDLGRMGMASVEIFPVAFLTPVEGRKVTASPISGKDGKDASREIVSSPLNPVYYGGEVGFLYGHSTGKFGGDDFGSYIIGGVGNDKFQITVGASYEESNGRIPRFRSFTLPR